MAQRRQLPSIPFCVSVVEEEVVSLMWRWERTGVLDRTPVVFRAGGHFTDIRDQPVGVAAERAVDLFDTVEIRELVPIDHEVLPTGDACDAVDLPRDGGGRVPEPFEPSYQRRLT
jgi:hypothetical protein